MSNGMGPRKKTAGEIAQIVGGQLQGPVADQVRRRLDAWNNPVAKLDRRHRRASRVMTVWISVLAVLSVIGLFAFLGVFGVAAGVGAAIGGAVVAVLAVRTGTRMRQLKAARQHLALTAPPVKVPLPAHSSAARQPMQRLDEAEDTLQELLRQLNSASLTSVPVESVDQARATSVEAASAIRAVSAQLQAVERARDTAPPLSRGPLIEGVRRLRGQLDEGVDGYCVLVAAAGRALAASTAVDHRHALTDATDHLAGLASALRDLSG
jgi:HAMP domain-containing protein